MDILVQDNVARELFPDGSPELHPDILIIRDYVGEVQENWVWDGTTFSAPVEPDATEEEVRAKRDFLLKETDFYALSDVTMPDEMATYRQALRDVPSQSGFPANVTWPTKP